MPCFRTLLGSRTFVDKGGGKEEVSRLSVENFCLTMQKGSAKEPLMFH